MEEWLAELRTRGKYPRLHSFLQESEKANHPTRRTWLLKTAVLAGSGLALTVAGRWAGPAKKKLSNKELAKRSVLSTALLLLGRGADISATRLGLVRTSRAIEKIKALEEFQRLPGPLQAKVIPPLESFEGNPLAKKSAVESVASRRIALAHTLKEGLGVSAALHGALWAGNRLESALSMASVIAGASFLAGLANLRTIKRNEEFLSTKDVRMELQLLHESMAAKERTP